MSAFHEALKRVFTAVDAFFNSTLKNENLGKTAEKERKKIVEILQKLYSEYEYLNPSNADEGSSSSSRDATQDESRNTLNSNHSNEEDSYADDIPDTTVKALSNHFKSGFLQKKRTDILGIFSKQKCYCVIHKNVMYWFKKAADKKQQGAFFITGYEFREIPQSDKEIAKKEFPFEVICTGKKTYQFVTESKEDLDRWREAVAKASKYVVTPSVSESVSEENILEDGEDLYEPLDEVSPMMRNLSQPSPKPLPDLPEQKFHVPELNEFDDPIEDYGSELYVEGESEKPTAAPQLPSRNTQLPPIPSVTSPVEEHDDGDEIYEFVDNAMPVPNPASDSVNLRSSIPTCPPPLPPHEKVKDENIPPPLPSRFLPSEKSAKELPPLPIRKRILTLGNVNLKGDDYENMYYGIWKCLGLTENELSFDQGDIIHVINKELDAENWWVGELKGQIGLVPKPFLSQAYGIVA